MPRPSLQWLLACLLLTLGIDATSATQPLTYTVKKTITLPSNCFVEGFLIHQQNMIFSCAGNGSSRLLRTDMQGVVLQEKTLADGIFSEGIIFGQYGTISIIQAHGFLSANIYSPLSTDQVC